MYITETMQLRKFSHIKVNHIPLQLMKGIANNNTGFASFSFSCQFITELSDY
jgi:hypothetical protein